MSTQKSCTWVFIAAFSITAPNWKQPRCPAEQYMAYPYIRILLSHKNEWNTDSCCNVNEPCKHCARHRSACILHDSVYTKWPDTGTSVGRESRVVVIEDWVWEWVMENGCSWVCFGGNENILNLDSEWLYDSVNMIKIFELYSLNGWILWFVILSQQRC